MARFKMRLGLVGSNNQASLEINGSDEWFPFISPLVSKIMHHHAADAANAALVRHELEEARLALNNQSPYDGQFVRVIPEVKVPGKASLGGKIR